MRIEICADSVTSALAARSGGADRVELCGNLFEGGTTPSAGVLQVARRRLDIYLYVLIRPRGGDFLYSPEEFEAICEDILHAKACKADGVVIGVLTSSGDIDLVRTEEMIRLARPMGVTFHRAFDMCRDPHSALSSLIELGVDRVLTSGQESTVIEGLGLIKELQRQASNRIIVMPGGGLNVRNVQRVVAETGVSEVHLSARKPVESGMTYRNTRVFMGGALRPPEFTSSFTDDKAVRDVVNVLRSSS